MKNLKTLVFSLGLAVMTLSATNLNAQDSGLFGRGEEAPESRDLGNNSMHSIFSREASSSYTITDNVGTGITNDGFGAPLGSGLVLLIGAGLGYVALKKKEDKQ